MQAPRVGLATPREVSHLFVCLLPPSISAPDPHLRGTACLAHPEYDAEGTCPADQNREGSCVPGPRECTFPSDLPFPVSQDTSTAPPPTKEHWKKEQPSNNV